MMALYVSFLLTISVYNDNNFLVQTWEINKKAFQVLTTLTSVCSSNFYFSFLFFFLF